MLVISLDEHYWSLASERSASQPVYEYSHREEDANDVGCLGEIVVAEWLRKEGVIIEDERAQTTHDYRLSNGETFDVKTKDRTVKPLHHYDCSVPLYNHEHQRPTYYIFVSLQRDKNSNETSIRRFHTVYILGGLNQKQLNAYGKVWKKGETDPANGTKFWTDCINVHVNRLTSCDAVLRKWRS